MILGASFDRVEDNRAFAEAQQLPFRLLSDIDRSVGRAYQVLRPETDRLADFPQRHAYLIDPAGRIARAYAVADVSNHAQQVLDDLAELVKARS